MIGSATQNVYPAHLEAPSLSTENRTIDALLFFISAVSGYVRENQEDGNPATNRGGRSICHKRVFTVRNPPYQDGPYQGGEPYILSPLLSSTSDITARRCSPCGKLPPSNPWVCKSGRRFIFSEVERALTIRAQMYVAGIRRSPTWKFPPYRALSASAAS